MKCLRSRFQHAKGAHAHYEERAWLVSIDENSKKWKIRVRVVNGCFVRCGFWFLYE